MDVNEEGTAAARGPFVPPHFVLYVLLCSAFVKPAIEGHHTSGWENKNFQKQAGLFSLLFNL